MNTHVALLFPPGWRYLSQPFLSLPSLAAYLREHGVSVSQRDLNLECMEYLSTSDGMVPVHGRAKRKFEELERRPSLHAVGQRYYANLAWAALQEPAQVANEIRWACDTLKGEGFYDPVRCSHALRLIFLTWDLLWAVMGDPDHPAAGIGSYLEDSLSEILAVVHDQNRNPLVEYLNDIVVPSVLAEKPAVVGVSVAVVSQLIPALTLARLLRRADKQIHIVFGGGVCTRLADVWRSRRELYDDVDSVVLYEGEGPLLDLTRALEHGPDLRTVPNLVYRQADKIRSNPIASPVALDELPTPDFDGLPLDRYKAPQLILPLLSSRGCYWGKCAFCDFNRAYAYYRRRDSRLVLRDIETLVAKHGIRFLYFSDEAVAPRTLEEVGRGLIQAGVKIRWYALARLEQQLTPQLCELLAQAGCTELDFGYETGSERLAAWMKKGVCDERALDVLRNVSQAGIVTRVNVIFGFPSETPQETRATMDFVLNNSDVIDAVVSQPFRLERMAAISADPAHYGVQIAFEKEKDTAFTHYRWTVPNGCNSGDGANLDRQFWREIAKRFPQFCINYVLDVALHFDQYGSKEKVKQAVQTRLHKHLTTLGPLIEERFSLESRPRLYEGLLCAFLQFDLSKISTPITNGLVLFQDIRATPSLEAKPAHVIINLHEACRVMQVSPIAAQVLRLSDGQHTVEAIAETVAERFHLTTAEAQRRSQGILTLHRTLLEPV